MLSGYNIYIKQNVYKFENLLWKIVVAKLVNIAKKQVLQEITWNKQCQIFIIFINISMVDGDIQRNESNTRVKNILHTKLGTIVQIFQNVFKIV